MQKIHINSDYRKLLPLILVGMISLSLHCFFNTQLDMGFSLRDDLNEENESDIFDNFIEKISNIFYPLDMEKQKEIRESHDYFDEYRLHRLNSNHDMKLNGSPPRFIKNSDKLNQSLHDRVKQMMLLIPAVQRKHLIEAFPKPKRNRKVAGANIMKLYEPSLDEYEYFLGNLTIKPVTFL